MLFCLAVVIEIAISVTEAIVAGRPIVAAADREAATVAVSATATTIGTTIDAGGPGHANDPDGKHLSFCRHPKTTQSRY